MDRSWVPCLRFHARRLVARSYLIIVANGIAGSSIASPNSVPSVFRTHTESTFVDVVYFEQISKCDVFKAVRLTAAGTMNGRMPPR